MIRLSTWIRVWIRGEHRSLNRPPPFVAYRFDDFAKVCRILCRAVHEMLFFPRILGVLRVHQGAWGTPVHYGAVLPWERQAALC